MALGQTVRQRAPVLQQYSDSLLHGRVRHADAGAGMVVRMQGFDKGVFGGNYHTHNMIQTPPGLDVVCFSNGWDWVSSSAAVFDSAVS